MKFAKDAPPEIIAKLLETCKWQADNDGKCKVNCSSCPGTSAYNGGLGCVKNGWTDGAISPKVESPTTKKNAEAFIRHHTKPKPARKKPQTVEMPNHLQVRIDMLQEDIIIQQYKVSTFVEQSKRARQSLRVMKAAHRAMVTQAKKEARK